MTEKNTASEIENIMSSILGIQQKSRAFINLLTEGEALSENHLLLLLQLKLTDGMKVTAISDLFHITPGAATSMCDKMEQMGLVERKREAKDRRVVTMVLTAAGRAKVEHLFLKFQSEKLQDIASILTEVNTLLKKIIV
ncbi:DNA-binding transcriptional regulator, MarR family [Terribacillus halophilus]|uniref:DNA-binding transcriptional regulator, MarR family n=1 Tax=Terribacillus halophilus TaxID=361279 RepID=A0A1G6KUV5_9BACI|nr:MarR family transcriptional regulator [Terribacillus halophilus]SDC34707.1 DNA-binding transcriptional regulator, MarR family [Terribacillus halophilus]